MKRCDQQGQAIEWLDSQLYEEHMEEMQERLNEMLEEML